MTTRTTELSEISQSQLPAFLGFPYLVTRIAPSLYHINLLPLDERYGFHRLLDIARRQVHANRLRACLVLDEQTSLFFEDGRETPSARIPFGGYIEHGKLVLCELLPVTEDLALRGEALEKFAQFIKSSEEDVYVLGDLTKGGRRPTEEENHSLSGSQENGVPRGLVRCPECREWCGECFDTNNPGLVVRVSCPCCNDTCCSGCGRTFGDRRLESNYYSEGDGKIWHVPAFEALTHHCSGPDVGDASRLRGIKSGRARRSRQ